MKYSDSVRFCYGDPRQIEPAAKLRIATTTYKIRTIINHDTQRNIFIAPVRLTDH